MAIKTKCQTPGANFETSIKDYSKISLIEVSVATPFPLHLTKNEAILLENNLHNAVELVLARYWEKNKQ